MKKYLGIIILLFISLFITTGCVGEDEIDKLLKEDMKKETIFKLEQEDEKSFTITIQNAKKGQEARGTLKVDENEELKEVYSFHGTLGLNEYLVPKGNTKEEALASGVTSGEGQGSISEIPAGEYEVLLIVEDEHLTGTLTYSAEKPEE